MPINWVDVPDPKNPPNGAPKLSAANLARLALIEDIGVAGTATGDALKAASDAQFSGRVVNPNDVGDDIVLVIGQSNAVGSGNGLDATYLDTPDPRIRQYAGLGTYLGQVVAATEGLLHPSQNATQVGPAISFAKSYLRRLPSNRHVLLVPCAYNSTGFTTSSITPAPTGYTTQPGGTWDPSNGDGGLSRYEFAIAQLTAALALNSTNRLAAILWVQGEADRDALTQSQYAAKLDQLIAGIRTRVPPAATTPFIIGQMLPDLISSSSGAAGINAAHIDTPRRDQLVSFAYGPTGMANGDGLHYNAAGARALGKAMWAAVALAQANVTGSAPIAPTAPVLTQSGTTVNLTWARPLCRVTDYNVQFSTNGGTTWVALTRAQSIDASAAITALTLGATVAVQVRSVNEQGNSPWPPSTTLTLVNLPGQVGSLAAGSPTSSAAPLTWAAPGSGGTVAAYLVEYKLHSGSTWTTATTTTALSATVTGLAAANQYDFRVTAQNAAGSGTASGTATATTLAQAALLTDVGVSSYRAYSLRKVNSSYAGSAIKVRRSSDNTTQDIGFAASGALDTTALLAFVGAGSGYIDTWYDQSGNARNLQQATTTKQARIVNAGVTDTRNGAPVAVFDGTATWYVDTTVAGIYAAGSSSVLAVSQSATNLGGFACLVSEGGGSAGQGYSFLMGASSAGTGLRISITNNSATTVVSASGGTSFATGALGSHSTIDTGSSVTGYDNGVQTITPVTYSRSGQTVTSDRFTLGALNNASATATNPWGGQLGEVVVFTTALSTGQRQAAEANQRTYFATP